jgi:hypothetical protein
MARSLSPVQGLLGKNARPEKGCQTREAVKPWNHYVHFGTGIAPSACIARRACRRFGSKDDHRSPPFACSSPPFSCCGVAHRMTTLGRQCERGLLVQYHCLAQTIVIRLRIGSLLIGYRLASHYQASPQLSRPRTSTAQATATEQNVVGVAEASQNFNVKDPSCWLNAREGGSGLASLCPISGLPVSGRYVQHLTSSHTNHTVSC